MKKITLIGLFLLLLLLITAGGIWYWNANKKRIIRNELEKAIIEKSKGLYKVSYRDLRLDEINGSLTVSLFTVTYDSSRLRQLQKKDIAPYLLFTITIPKIHVEGVETPRALIDKEIHGRHLTILNPVIQITYTNTGKDSARNVPDKEIYKQILGGLSFIKLDSVVITGAEIITKNSESGETRVHFQNTSISLLDVAVDSLADADTSRILYAKEVSLDCEKIQWQSKDKLYNYRIDSVSLRSASSFVNIKNFLVIPLFKEAALANTVSYQTDRTDFAIHDIQFRDIDFFCLADEIIKTDTLIIGSASFKLYRDRNMPQKNENKTGNYPHQSIQKIPVRFEIKKAIIKNTFIEYKEKSTDTYKSGKVQFRNSSAEISNITNRKEVIGKNNLMVFDIHSNFLNKIPIYTRWTFYLGHPEGRFDLSGKMGRANAKIFNVLTEPLGPVSFNSGQLNNLQFEFSGTDYSLSGKVKLYYDDLKVALLKKEEDSRDFKKKHMASLLANIKIKNSNPDKNKEPRVADVRYKRDVRKSIFNLAWKGLFEGAKEITGANK